jgi:uncharacterized protein YbaP (TraB family)
MFLYKEMTLKIIFALLLCLFGLDSLQAKELISEQCEPLIESTSAIEEVEHSQGLLWKISKAGKETSYLFGTIHISDKDVTTLPASVDKALHNSNQFVMEALPNMDEMMALSKSMFFGDGQLLSKFVDAPIYDQTKNILASYQLGADAVSVMKPWAAFLVMNYPPDQGEPLDLVLLSLAQQNGATVAGLESLKEQGEIFSQMKMDEQVTLLTDTVCHYDTVEADFLAMKVFYLKRDLGGLYNYSQQYSMSEKPVYKNLMKKLITDRNKKMANRMQAMLEKGSAFVAIGALHLPGKEGVLSLLEKKGYSVSAVY